MAEICPRWPARGRVWSPGGRSWVPALPRLQDWPQPGPQRRQLPGPEHRVFTDKAGTSFWEAKCTSLFNAARVTARNRKYGGDGVSTLTGHGGAFLGRGRWAAGGRAVNAELKWPRGETREAVRQERGPGSRVRSGPSRAGQGPRGNGGGASSEACALRPGQEFPAGNHTWEGPEALSICRGDEGQGEGERCGRPGRCQPRGPSCIPSLREAQEAVPALRAAFSCLDSCLLGGRGFIWNAVQFLTVH